MRPKLIGAVLLSVAIKVFIDSPLALSLALSCLVKSDDVGSRVAKCRPVVMNKIAKRRKLFDFVSPSEESSHARDRRNPVNASHPLSPALLPDCRKLQTR